MQHKNHLIHYLLALLTIILIPVMQSCSLKQVLNIDSRGSGNVNFELTLAPFFVEVTEQLSALFPEEGEIPEEGQKLFDLEKINEDFSKGTGTILENLESPSNNILKGNLIFDNISTALNGAGTNNILDIFSFTTVNNIHTLSVVFNYKTVEKFLTANPSFNSPLMENFGPLANRGLSDEDFLEMMQFALGDESRLGIKGSFLFMDVNVKGKIVDQIGGIVVDQDTVRFQIPLLRILLLDEPESFSVRFSD